MHRKYIAVLSISLLWVNASACSSVFLSTPTPTLTPTFSPTSTSTHTPTNTSIPPTPTVNKGIQDPTSGHWYLVLPTMGWDRAVNYCSTLAGHLIIIDDANEDDFVYNNIAKYNSGVLFGATDKDEEGHWVWANGEELQYSNWADGEPNNCGNASCDPEHYVSYHGDHPGQWNDVPGGEGGYICEFEK